MEEWNLTQTNPGTLEPLGTDKLGGFQYNSLEVNYIIV
jgi:hypothetical protein